MHEFDTRPLADQIRETTRFTQFLHLADCESTQDLAQTLRGAAIVWADEQRTGRGRLGRSWHGAAGLDVEVTFRVEGLTLADSTVLAAAIPAAVAGAVEPFAERPIQIDWPNDVLCDGRKLAGVLIDASGNPPSTFLIGVGLNVNRTTFPPELVDAATSLALAAGGTHDRERVLFAVARAIDDALTDLDRGEVDRLAIGFRDRLRLTGRTVRIVESGRELTGRLTDIDLQRAVLDEQRVIRLALVQELELVR